MSPDRYKVKVLKNLKVTLYFLLALNPLCLPHAKAEDLNTQEFIKRLSNALNTKEISSLSNLFRFVSKKRIDLCLAIAIDDAVQRIDNPIIPYLIKIKVYL